MRLHGCYRSVVSAGLLLACATLSAQVGNNTTLVGTVSDPDGNVVAGAKITALNEDTHVAYPGTTNDHGNYAIQFILPGTYDITVDNPGFRKEVKTGVIVAIDQAARTDFQLPVGNDTTLITISAFTPPLETDDATLGETFDTKTIVDLPFFGHNALEIATLASNVSVGGNSSYSGVPPGEDFIGAGQREIQNSLNLDGVSIMNNLLSAAPARPSSDMISEVQMQSGNYPAQYGSYLGVHINMVSKNGTNDLHGAVYDYIQNTALDAHQFTDPVGASKQVQHYNQYGFDLGGPVYLPWLYNGRDHTFFFTSYERINQVQQNSNISSSLTSAERNGDFSAVGTVKPDGTCDPTSLICLTDPTTGAFYPGNKIPAAQLNTPAARIAKQLEGYMTLPNRAGTQNGTVNNILVYFPADLVISQNLERLDENIGEHVRLFARYHWQNITNIGGSVFPSNASYGPTDSRNFAVGYTHVITPHLINDFRFGYNKLTSNNLDYFEENNLPDAGTKLGIPGFNADTTDRNPGLPNFNIDGYEGLGNDSANWYQDDRTKDGYDEISYTRGKHNIMAGVEIRKLTTGREAANDARGIFDFYAGGTDAGDVTSTGYGGADFVLGLAQDSVTPIFPVKGSIAEWRDGFFVLDNWQPFQRLTLNYGLRYELPTVPYSLNGYTRILNAAQTALIPSTTAITPGAFVPVPGFKFIDPTHNNWSPRLGFAFRPTDHNTVRGGFGIYYNANQLNTYTLTTQNYPLSNSASYFTDPSNLLTLTNPTPGAASTSPVGGTPGTYVNAITMGPHLPVQTLYQWNLSAGQEVWKNGAIELQYLGSHAIHLDRNFYNNTPQPGPGDDINSRRPNQLFGRIRDITNDAYSHYNALTAILRQRTAHGFSGMLSYTWSHDQDITDDSNGTGNTQNNYDIAADYGDSGWDVRQRFVGEGSYELPKLMTSKPALRYSLGGWQVNTVVNLNTGGPYNVILDFDNANISQPRDSVQRPNVLHTPYTMHCTTKNYINQTPCLDPTAFAVPAPYTFGNARRDMGHGPGFENVAFSLFKTFPIYERVSFQMRAEVGNLFNHPSIGGPATDISSPTYDGNNPATYSGFGMVGGTQSGSRAVQLAGKLIF